jgi:hypothetical protein
MVQMDGSFHRWLEERGPEGCLMDLVDDATGTTLARLGVVRHKVCKGKEKREAAENSEVI